MFHIRSRLHTEISVDSFEMSSTSKTFTKRIQALNRKPQNNAPTSEVTFRPVEKQGLYFSRFPGPGAESSKHNFHTLGKTRFMCPSF